MAVGSSDASLNSGALFSCGFLPLVLRYLTVTDSLTKRFSDINEPRAYLEECYLNIKQKHEAELKRLTSQHELLLFNAVKHEYREKLHSLGVNVSYAVTAEFMVQHWDAMFPGSPKIGA